MKNARIIRSNGGDLFKLFESGIVTIDFENPHNLSGLSRAQIKEH